MIRFYHLVLGTILCLSHSTYAQVASDTSGLDPVTVTASINPLQSSRTGRNITVIKGELFQSMPVNSVDELLRYMPGIEIQSRGPMGAQADISIRGGTFQQVLVILDGMRLNDPNTGHFSAYIPIAPAEIDRIEILKGPASAIYGTEAVGGVIHIITKTFSRKAEKNNISAGLTYGEYDLWNGQAGLQWHNDKHYLGAGLLTNHTKGQPQRGTRGFLDMTTISLAYGVNIGKHWKASFRGAYDYRDFSAQNFYTAFASDTAKERVKTSWNQAQVTYQKNGLVWTTSAGYKWLNDRFQFNSRLSPNNNTSKQTQVLSTLSLPISDAARLVGGLQYQHKSIKSNDRGNHTIQQVGFFGIWEQQLGERWMLNPALRLDYHDRMGWNVVPQLTASYKAPKWQLRAVAGRTLRDADFTERFNNYNRTNVRSGSIGNPDLTEESSFSYEAGADFIPDRSLKLSTTIFSRRQNGAIDFVPTKYEDMPRKVNLVPGGLYALASNVAKTNTTGIEMDLQWQKSWGKQSILTTAGLLWMDTKILEGTPGFYLSSHARWLTNAQLVYGFGRFSIALNALYKIREERKAAAIGASITRDYFLLNMKVQARVGRARLFVQMDNVGDIDYADILGSVMPGRWLMGGIQVNLQQD